MFLEFSVENFRSIADRQTLSFVAGKHKSEAEGSPAVDEPGFNGGKVLTSAVIYGANGAGKSNLLRALNAMVERIARSSERSATYLEPFRLDPVWLTKPSRFELSFIKEGVRYQYGFAADRERVHEEWLIAYPKRAPQVWFERRLQPGKPDIHFGPHLKGEKIRLAEMTRPDALFLSVAAQFNHPQLLGVRDWLVGRLIAQPSRGFGALPTARAITENPKLLQGVHLLLKDADLGISGISVRRHEKLPDGKPGAKFVVDKHTKEEVFEIVTEHIDADGHPVEFSLRGDESDGTNRYFELLMPMMLTLALGGLLAIDELDQSLHPLLVRQIVHSFSDPKLNKYHAQLLFNSHDVTLLDPKLFRRDQIWFAEKESNGKTRIYSLLEYSPRKDEALQRGYLQGRYGAIPFLGDLRFPSNLGSTSTGRSPSGSV